MLSGHSKIILKMSPKKIYLFYEFLSEQGGLERELINHANMLIEEGYEVKILTCHLNKKILTQLPFEGIPIIPIPKIHTRFESLNLALCALGFHNLKKYNPDAFIVYSFPTNFLVRNKKSKKINYLNHFLHAYHMSWKEKIEWASGTQGIKRWISVIASIFLSDWLKRLDKYLVKRNDLIFTNSEYTKKKLDKLYSINTIVSYPPLDPKFNTISKKDIKDSFIFSSSRIIPDKKYEFLIDSASYMKNKLPIYLAGSVEESYKQTLLNRAKKNKVNLKFLGRLDTETIKAYYKSATLFAFPTPEEDFGLVPAESMSSGTPVVVWGDGAGPTEQVIDGITGYHAKPYDLKDYAKKMDMVIDTKLKSKNKNKIINNAKRFSYSQIKKDFVKKINESI